MGHADSGASVRLRQSIAEDSIRPMFGALSSAPWRDAGYPYGKISDFRSATAAPDCADRPSNPPGCIEKKGQ
jgi:hypothetical protein